jgi:XTP/dITP diphosphohydrolase
MKIVFASHNAGKIREITALLTPLNIQIISSAELGITDIAETGLTFVENALIKARHASQHCGLPAIADDSGLEVQALQGGPGIYSARYAGEKASAKDCINKLLSEMQAIPDNKRQANFHCTLVYLNHAADPVPLICEGDWHGVILKQPQGDDGFGYDPIFFDPKEQCSAAELPLDKKNRLSHRGQALRMLVTQLPRKWL